MVKLRFCISMLMLALLLFPIAEKAAHEYEHVEDEHCGIEDTHFCKVEHSCSICDYTFSVSSTPPKNEKQCCAFLASSDRSVFGIVSNAIASPNYTFSLRGPPTC